MANHSNVTDGNVHRPYRQVFADDAARTGDATGYTAADLYKKAYQVDTSAEYVLTAITPTWTAVGGGGGVQGGAFPSVNKRITQTLATITQGGGITAQLTGLTVSDVISANAGLLALSAWIMTRYVGGQLRQEQYTALIRLTAGGGDPTTRIADFTETNMLSDGVGFTSIEGGFSDFIGGTGVVEMTFDDGQGGQGNADAVVVAAISEFFET